MINLLPYDEKEKALKERLRRAIVVFSLALASILLIGIILMLPAYFYLFFQKQGVERQLQGAEQEADKSETEALKKEVAGINSKLSILDNAGKSSKPVAGLFSKVLRAMPEGVSVKSISYSASKGQAPGSMALDGKADTRDAFILFKKNIEESGDFSKIESPVSNLLSEKDVDFSLTLTIK